MGMGVVLMVAGGGAVNGSGIDGGVKFGRPEVTELVATRFAEPEEGTDPDRLSQ